MSNGEVLFAFVSGYGYGAFITHYVCFLLWHRKMERMFPWSYRTKVRWWQLHRIFSTRAR